MRMLLIFFVLTFSIFLSAQNRAMDRTPEQLAAKQTAALQRVVDITESQKDTIYAVYYRYALQKHSDDIRDTIVNRNNRMRAEIENILTQEQVLIWRSALEEYEHKKTSRRMQQREVR